MNSIIPATAARKPRSESLDLFAVFGSADWHSGKLVDRLSRGENHDRPAAGVEVLGLDVDSEVVVDRGKDVLGGLGFGLGKAPLASDAPTTRPPWTGPPPTRR